MGAQNAMNDESPKGSAASSLRTLVFAIFLILAIVALAVIGWLFTKGLLVEAAIALFALLMAALVAMRSRRLRARDEPKEFGGETQLHIPAAEKVEPRPVTQSLQIKRDNLVTEELDPVLKLSEAARKLEDEETKRILFVSPDGEGGSAASIRYARERADKGGRVVLVDMTTEGVIARPTLEGSVKAGITDLLSGSARYADAIHADLYSDTHIVPLGRVDPERAMRDADRLPIILNALAVAYDVVVIECGASSAEGLHRLADKSCSICISVVRDRKRAMELKYSMVQLGYPTPYLVWAEI
ncbi:tyrosine-protein kinase family protein [Limoniibacter endophyticus]|uniref:Mrp family chromosome partitioning ATPase n=1 Tax=Limoniibacter endophyticus TaxID=1565040 RepID=A0A8J3DR55_9HYPH|nr:tyrosine-protein kinase family protein [Limoniibacter endophyticus]GHC79140.1 hypothetical protein GCM10010136_31450 [Limoniibacter endophyticus]